MGKADADHTPEQPPLDDPRWSMSIEAAHKRLTERFSDTALATIELMKALADGRLPCMARSRHSGESRSVAPAEWADEIELLSWKNLPRVFSRRPSVRVLARRQTSVREQIHDLVFYVWQPAFDRIWLPPAGSAPVDHGDASEPAPRVKPGPKAKGDWPDLIARWLIEVGRDDPQKLQKPNIDELAVEAELFLRNQNKFVPKDSKVIRAKIRELLTPVRR